jgi:two-component system sensor histidine kinase and response regulator WspE
VIRVPREIIKVVQSCQYFTFDEKRIGLVEARQVLQVAGSSKIHDTLNVVIISDRVNQYGLIVDNFWGIRDLVVQPLDTRLGKIKDINAASVLEDGTPVLILDVEDMVRSMDIFISDDRLRPIVDKAEDDLEVSIKQILVVDDSITVREVEKKLLTAKGYTVKIAVDGIDALNSLHSNRYDLLITDIDMPRMDGIELVHSIRREPKLATLPIIIVSYKDRVEDRNRGLEAGADYYLTKGSFQDETLANAVRDLIGEA